MSIRGRALILALVVSVLPLAILLVLTVHPRLTTFSLTELKILVTAALCVGVALLVAPSRDLAERLFDRHAERARTRSQALLRRASAELGRDLDLGQLAEVVVDTIQASVEPAGIALYLGHDGAFRCAAVRTIDNDAAFLTPVEPPPEIVRELATRHAVVLRDDIDRSGDPPLRDALDGAEWALVLPLVSDQRLLGLVAVGPKRSRDPFFAEDLDALVTLANHAGSALKNGNLYAEVGHQRARAESFAGLQRLIQMLAHEIGNPLVPIKTLTKLLPTRVGDHAFAADLARIVSRELERIERLVARLRRLAPIGEPRHAQVDLRVPIQHALEVVEAEASANATAIDVRLAPSPVLVFGDSAELEELFLNLLTNALEAVADQPAPHRLIQLAVIVDRDRAVATVRDSGGGIDADVMSRIFDTCVTTKPRGSGLGLAICQGIAERHQARLTAANSGAGGAIFTVELPWVGERTKAPVEPS